MQKPLLTLLSPTPVSPAPLKCHPFRSDPTHYRATHSARVPPTPLGFYPLRFGAPTLLRYHPLCSSATHSAPIQRILVPLTPLGCHPLHSGSPTLPRCHPLHSTQVPPSLIRCHILCPGSLTHSSAGDVIVTSWHPCSLFSDMCLNSKSTNIDTCKFKSIYMQLMMYYTIDALVQGKGEGGGMEIHIYRNKKSITLS